MIELSGPNGRVFEIDNRKNHIYVKTGNKGMFLPCTWDQFFVSWLEWTQGSLIQVAFEYLDADAREFLITGLLPSEWDEIMNETIGNEN